MNLRAALVSGHRPSLFAAFLHFDVSFMVWVMLGGLGLYIAQDFGLSATQKGVMVGIPLLGGAMFRIVLGVCTDHFGPKKTGAFSLFFTLLPLLWGWLGATDINQVYALGVLLGIAGASFAVALPLASQSYPPQYQGLAMGIAGAGNSGTVITLLAAPRLAEAYGWHAVFGFAMIPVVVTLLCFVTLAQDSPVHRPTRRSLGSYLAVLTQPDTGWFCALYWITFGGFVGMASYLGIFFADQYGMSRLTAMNLSAACVVSGSLLRPVGGYSSDRFGGLRVLSVVYGVVGGCLTTMAFHPALTTAVGLMVVAMASMGVGNGAVFQLVPQRFRQEIGTVTGLVGAAGGLGGFFLPSVFGALKDLTGTYAIAWGGAGALALIGLAVVQIKHPAWTRAWAVRTSMSTNLDPYQVEPR
jgi:NNP family nitrate/nitrite transporter-like MFS transporter